MYGSSDRQHNRLHDGGDGRARPHDDAGHRCLGHIVKVTDALNGATNYAYTALGELGQVIDAAGNMTLVTYDARGQKASSSDPDLGQWFYGFSVFGELTAQTDAKGQTVAFAYDQLGRPTSRTEAEGTTSWQYYTASGTNLGLLEKVTDPGGYSRQYMPPLFGGDPPSAFKTGCKEIRTEIDAARPFE